MRRFLIRKVPLSYLKCSMKSMLKTSAIIKLQLVLGILIIQTSHAAYPSSNRRIETNKRQTLAEVRANNPMAHNQELISPTDRFVNSAKSIPKMKSNTTVSIVTSHPSALSVSSTALVKDIM